MCSLLVVDTYLDYHHTYSSTNRKEAWMEVPEVVL